MHFFHTLMGSLTVVFKQVAKIRLRFTWYDFLSKHSRPFDLMFVLYEGFHLWDNGQLLLKFTLPVHFYLETTHFEMLDFAIGAF